MVFWWGLWDKADYTAKFTGTDTGEMTYAVQDNVLNGDSVEASSIKTFENVIIDEGKEMVSNVSGNLTAPEVQLLVLDDNGEPIKEIQTDGTETGISTNNNPSDNSGDNNGSSNSGSGDPTTITPPPDPNQSHEQEWQNPFTDVTGANWFFEDVQFVSEHGLMHGVNADKFSPYQPMTRGMLVTVLYRMEEELAVSAISPFTDLTQDYYKNAVSWAYSNGIISGMGNNEFFPNAPVTREQVAAILYRYAEYKKYDITAQNDLLVYIDAEKISTYAIFAMQWVNAEGLITGRSQTELVPQGEATRAEIAAILRRFVEHVASL